MVALLIALAVVLLSLLVTRVATIALSLTGLSREAARFQARSAFSGVGFTTSEAESVVGHPVRRRIVLTLMLLGSAGIVGALASLVISFGGAESGEGARRAGLFVIGLGLIVLLARSSWFDRRLSQLIGRMMRARGLDARDYARLLDLSGDYTVAELLAQPEDWLAGRALGDLRLRDEGVIVLGVHRRHGGYIGVPGKRTVIAPGDTLVVYGREERLAELDNRSRDAHGERAAEEAREDQRECERRESAEADVTNSAHSASENVTPGSSAARF